MAGPFYDNICGTVTAAPGTAAFTPTGAFAASLAWSTLPPGTYAYRADETGAWEIGYGLWNGTTLTRAVIVSSNANALVSFGTGVVISLTEAADEVQPHLASNKFSLVQANAGAATLSTIGMVAPTVTGTGSAGAIAATNSLTRHQRLSITSGVAAAGALSSVSNLTAGNGFLWSTDAADIGFEFVAHFGWSTLATPMRVLIGAATANLAAAATEPSSTINNSIYVGKDSTDTNFQLIFRSGAATTKVDMGLAPVANIAYEVSIIKPPGNRDVIAALLPLDGATAPVVKRVAAGTANLPTNNTVVFPICSSGLMSTLTNASVLNFIHMMFRHTG